MRFMSALCAFLVLLLSSCDRRPPESEASRARNRNLTEQLIKMHLEIAIERYRFEFKRLPPLDVAELTASSSRWKAFSNLQNNVLNESAEVLLVALRHPELSVPITESDWGFDNPTANRDGAETPG